MKNRVIFSSISDEWSTPIELYKALDNEFNFDFDPCPLRKISYPLLNLKSEKEIDGLSIEWGSCNYVNPPYSEINKWCEKAVREWKKGKTVVMLIPSRTDTKYWHNYIMQASEIRFCRGRLFFGNAKFSAPFPSAIIIFNKEDGNE